MFKLYVPITKSAKSKDGAKLLIEGLASSPTIDKEQERFDPSAIVKMCEAVNEGGIPIRVEHQHKYYTEVGSWTKAWMDEDSNMYVKGEIDLEMSLGRDAEVLLRKGKPLALSVGGRVIEAAYEYVDALKKQIRTYKEIVLEEISLVMNPANPDATLSLAKSVDWDKMSKSQSLTEVPYTTQAQKLIKAYKGMEKLSPDEFTKKVTPENVKKSSFVKSIDEQVSAVFGKFDMDGPAESSEPYALSAEDLQAITMLIRIMESVDLPSDDEEMAMIDSDEYWEKLNLEGEDGYIILSDRRKVMPHHNGDYTVNRDWVLLRMKQLVDGRGWWKPKDFQAILSHLYQHLKEFELVKSGNKATNNVSKSMDLTQKEIDLIANCYKFTKGEITDRPLNLAGEALSDEELATLAKSYEALRESGKLLQVMQKAQKSAEAGEEANEVEDAGSDEDAGASEEEAGGDESTEDAPDESEDSEAGEESEEEGSEEASEEAEESEESAEEAEEAEEAADGEEASEEAESEEAAEADASEEAEAEEAAPAEAEASVDVAEEVGKAMKQVSKGFVSKSEHESLQKSVKDVLKAVSALTKKVEKSAGLGEEVAKLAGLVKEMAEKSQGRKSVARHMVIAKSVAGDAETNAPAASFNELVDKFIKEDGLAFSEAYKKAKETLAAQAAE